MSASRSLEQVACATGRSLHDTRLLLVELAQAGVAVETPVGWALSDKWANDMLLLALFDPPSVDPPRREPGS